jgi:hypothetical protein
MTITDDLISIAQKALDLLDEYGCESEASEELHKHLQIIIDEINADN